MFWFPVVGVNLYFSRWSPFLFNSLEVSEGEMPPSVTSEGGCGEVEQEIMFCLQIEKIRRLPHPWRNIGKWWSQSECGVWNVVARRWISDILSGFTFICVSCVARLEICATLSRWPSDAESRYLWGRGGQHVYTSRFSDRFSRVAVSDA